MKVLRFGLLFFVIFLLPTLALGSGGTFNVPATDKSMQYLGMIFGNVGSLPIQGSGNALFSQIIYIFNEVVFALGITIVISTTIIGTLKTAQEGEVLGKSWSTFIIPIRAGAGIYLLLPMTGGYNWIQISVMWFIVQGVGAANALWQQVVYSNQSQGSLLANTQQVNVLNSQQALGTLFTSVLCMEEINNLITNSPLISSALNGEYITMYQSPGQVNFGQASQVNSGNPPICGYVTIPNIGGNAITANLNGTPDAATQERSQMMGAAIIQAAAALTPAADEAMTVGSPSWSHANAFTIAANALTTATSSMSQTFSSLNQVNQQAITDGWIEAGTYYFQLVSGGTYSNVPIAINGSGANAPGITGYLGNDMGTQLTTMINNLSGAYQMYAVGNVQGVSPADQVGGKLIAVPNVSASGSAGDALGAIFGGSFFSTLAANLGTQITTGCLSNSTNPSQQNGDPVVCMASFGSGMAATTELIFWAALIALFFIWLGATIGFCMQPLGPTVNFMIMVIVPIVIMALSLIWAAGISLALYVPLIPFLVFTFAAMGWFLLVIEAMLGAPLIALSLIIPSEDELGKAGHAIAILLGLFLRPGLMILGFIFAGKILMVAIGMLNFGFSGTLQMSVGNGSGLFGFISIIMLYSGVAIGMVHEAFSLIYVLPDKILRWMGGGPEDTSAGEQVKQLKGSVEKGAGMGKGAMTKMTQKMGDKAQGAMSK